MQKNVCPKIKICFGYVELQDFHGNLLCDYIEWGYTYIYTDISAAAYLRILNLLPNQSKLQRHIIIIIIIIIHHHHHHHIHLKHVFLYQGFSLFFKHFSKTSSPLKMILRVNRIHSKFLSAIHQTSSEVSFACPVSSVQLHLACIRQQSSLCCAQRIPTTSIYWCGAP